MVAKDKIRPAAIKAGIRLERGQRFGFHNSATASRLF
jgi:hypothetical protein